MKRILRLIIIAVVAFVILKGSTFGWRFWSRPFAATEEDSQSVDRLKAHVYQLSHEIGERSIFMYERLEEAAEYITKDFKSIGYDVEFQEYDLMNKRVKNIIAIKIGTQRPDEIVIVGAHYDTCFNPGADDNASAVAGLLELARFMYDKKRDCTIRFIAFVNEEPPFFKTDEMGSSVYARAARSRRDTIGFVPGVDFSDNWSFWREGYPAVMITDTAFYRNPNYHNSTDTHETLDYASLAEVLKGLRGVLIELTK